MNRLVILAPNWLGDAVMALPAIADVRRSAREAHITVAARPAIAPLFGLVSDVNDTIVLTSRASVRDVSTWRELGVELSGGGFDTALLLPNSMHAALVAKRAGIPERWGYRRAGRGVLLTRAIDPPSGLHQVEYYQQLVHALGFPNGPLEPRITIPETIRELGADALKSAGWNGRTPLAALAPGAAYGGAKRWPPEYFGELARALASDGVECVMIGTPADAETAADVARAFEAGVGALAASAPSALRRASPDLAGLASERRREKGVLHDLVGKTDLPTLAGVMATCRALVTNDSGAMHLAAAVGVPVTAVFGPTDDQATRPMGDAHAIITHPVWCRPCMLRECPLDHLCMRGIAVADVLDRARRTL